MFNESMVKEFRVSFFLNRIIIIFFRITGEPLFGNVADGLLYSEQFGNGNSNEHSSSLVQTGAVGFDFHSNAVLSTGLGHEQILHGAAGYHPDESDGDDLSEDYDDIDDEDDDEPSNGDESSQGELDE